MDCYIRNFAADTEESIRTYEKIQPTLQEIYVHIEDRNVCIPITPSKFIVFKNTEVVICSGDVSKDRDDLIRVAKGVITVVTMDKAYSIKFNGKYVIIYEISTELFSEHHNRIFMEFMLENGLIKITEANLSFTHLFKDSADIEGEIKFRYTDGFEPNRVMVVIT